ncbi:MAG: aminotransferase class V-fold PLP-dependent enzyme [Planctomycetota bacterium]
MSDSSQTDVPGNRRVYLDNAATSFPKPPAVTEAMSRYATELGASPGRGAYFESLEGAAIIRRCREAINELIGGASPEHITFTLNTSDALNLAIHGLVQRRRRRLIERGDDDQTIHLVTTEADHNSILRPFNHLQGDPVGPRVEWTCVPVSPLTGKAEPDDLRRAIRRETTLVAVQHASNVTGVIQPVGEFGAVCRDLGVPMLVDAAQTIGRLPIDVGAMSIDLLAFPGHKHLMGPLGTGGLYMRPGLERLIDPVRQGGTGSRSEQDTQPSSLPDRYEPGSHNTVGLAGLEAGVRWVLDRTVDEIRLHEERLIEQTVRVLSSKRTFPGLRLIGPRPKHGVESRVGVFSVVHEVLTPHELAGVLEGEFGVLVRAGIHCAPRMHKAVGTAEGGGAVRLSYGPFTTPEDAEYALSALAAVCSTVAAS